MTLFTGKSFAQDARSVTPQPDKSTEVFSETVDINSAMSASQISEALQYIPANSRARLKQRLPQGTFKLRATTVYTQMLPNGTDRLLNGGDVAQVVLNHHVKHMSEVLDAAPPAETSQIMPLISNTNTLNGLTVYLVEMTTGPAPYLFTFEGDFSWNTSSRAALLDSMGLAWSGGMAISQSSPPYARLSWDSASNLCTNNHISLPTPNVADIQPASGVAWQFYSGQQCDAQSYQWTLVTSGYADIYAGENHLQDQLANAVFKYFHNTWCPSYGIQVGAAAVSISTTSCGWSNQIYVTFND